MVEMNSPCWNLHQNILANLSPEVALMGRKISFIRLVSLCCFGIFLFHNAFYVIFSIASQPRNYETITRVRSSIQLKWRVMRD